MVLHSSVSEHAISGFAPRTIPSRKVGKFVEGLPEILGTSESPMDGLDRKLVKCFQASVDSLGSRGVRSGERAASAQVEEEEKDVRGNARPADEPGAKAVPTTRQTGHAAQGHKNARLPSFRRDVAPSSCAALLRPATSAW